MRVIDVATNTQCTVTIEGDWGAVKITGNRYCGWLVQQYLEGAYGYGGHVITPEETTMFDVVYALTFAKQFRLLDIPDLPIPEIPEGAVS